MRPSRLPEIYEKVFGRKLGSIPVIQDIRSVRDALHLDQCWSNMVDYFLTGEKKLRGLTLDFRICDADVCLLELKRKFEADYGTSEIEKLAKHYASLGPVILGSNDGYGIKVSDPNNNEVLLWIRVFDEHYEITAKIYSEIGEHLVTLDPGEKILFGSTKVRFIAMEGPSPLKVSTSTCKDFVLTFEGTSLLYVRVLRDGRLLVQHATIRNRLGKEIFSISRESLSFTTPILLGDECLYI